MVCSLLQRIGFRESWCTELVSMMLFVYIGCGTAAIMSKTPIGGPEGYTQGDWHINVALAFGLAITVIAYATAHRSGGHINCAVTIALMISSDCEIVDGIGIIISQLIGSIIGAALLAATVPDDMDATGGLGCNGLADGYNAGNAFVGETLMTFLLMYTVYETAVSTRPVTRSKPSSEFQPVMGPLAIGLSVFLAHIVLLNITGCSINPTRSFGPAVVATIRGKTDAWDYFWIFVLAPILGASLAAGAKIVDKAYAQAPKAAQQQKARKRSANKEVEMGEEEVRAEQIGIITEAAAPTSPI